MVRSGETKMVVQTKKILKNLIFKAKPDEIYEAWMDSKKHMKFTESKAKISNEVGGNFICGDGYIKGKSIELIPGEKIVQQWQADEAGWPKKHYSTITIILERVEEGTKFKFKQTGVPVKCYDDIKQGWNDYYWGPLKNYLEGG